jgi:hypothetical protein
LKTVVEVIRAKRAKPNYKAPAAAKHQLLHCGGLPRQNQLPWCSGRFALKVC